MSRVIMRNIWVCEKRKMNHAKVKIFHGKDSQVKLEVSGPSKQPVEVTFSIDFEMDRYPMVISSRTARSLGNVYSNNIGRKLEISFRDKTFKALICGGRDFICWRFLEMYEAKLILDYKTDVPGVFKNGDLIFQ